MMPAVLVQRLQRRILALVVSMLLLVVCALLYVATTNKGLQQAITLGQRWLPGELQIQRVDGRLLDAFTLHGVSFRHPDIQISLKRLSLDWRPQALLSGTVHIHAIELTEAELSWFASPADASATSSPLPRLALTDIALPFGVLVDSLSITELWLHPPAEAGDALQPIQITQAQVQLHSEQDRWRLNQLNVVAPLGQLQLAGQVRTSGQYPLSLKTRWELKPPDAPALMGEGTIGGDLAELKIEQQLTGLLAARASASLQLLQSPPTGTVQLEALHVALGNLYQPLAGHDLRGTMTLSGNQDAAELNGHWQINLPQLGDSELQARLALTPNALRLHTLHLIQQRTNTRLALQGDLGWQQPVPEFALHGSWTNLRYPLQGEQASATSDGQFTVSGNLHDYLLELHSSVGGDMIPTGAWRLTTRGDTRGLRDLSLTGDTLNGRTRVQGSVHWQPAVQWQLNVVGEQLNPGIAWRDWPGQINFQASSTGTKTPGEPLQLQATINSLTGSIREHPVTGHASATLSGQDLIIPEIALTLAGVNLSANGDVGKEINLDWSLKADDLNTVLPDTQGSIAGSGTVRGYRDQPMVRATLQGHSLELDNNRIGTLSADLDVDLSGRRQSRIKLHAAPVSMAGNRWRQLTIAGDGTPAQHTFALDLSEGPVDLALRTSGQWHKDRWTGLLTRADVRPQWGLWELQRPVTILASMTDLDLDALCWGNPQIRGDTLCLAGSWSSTGGIQATLDSVGLPLNIIDPWLTRGIQAEGQLQATASYRKRLNAPPEFDVSLATNDAAIRSDHEEWHISMRDVTADIKGQGDRLDADVRLVLRQPEGALHAQLSIDDLYDTRALAGTLEMNLTDLSFISAFVPHLQENSGKIESSLKLRGSLAAPIILGRVRLIDGGTELPALGIKLEAINLEVSDLPESTRLQLHGTLRSGGGSAELDGWLDPMRSQAQLSLKGENFQAIATQDVQAWLSPDMTIGMSAERISLRGVINVPTAKFMQASVKAAAPVSADVVILETSDTRDTSPSARRYVMDTDLRFSLGDNVEVDLYGFKGRLLGSVQLEDDGRRAVRATGGIQVAVGKYRLYGQDLNVDRGSLVYSGGPVDNPGLDLRVSRKVDEVTVGAKVSGTLNEPRLALFSDPDMPESNQLSYLMFGRPPGSGGTPSEQELLFKAAALLTMKQGNLIAENLTEVLQVDELGLESGDTLGGTSLYIGKYLTPRLYVKYGVGLLESANAFLMRYRLTRNWSLETTTDAKSSGGDIIYTLER